jgi:FSR family fosmidomycin resistance protein-like MFS transporter
LWLCTALHGFTHLYQVALLPLYLLIRDDFGLESEAEATFLVTALSIAYFLPSYPMGVLADRMSRKKLLAIGLLVNALAFIALAFAPNYWVALSCVIIAGLGGSFYHPAATALVARLFPDEKGKALGKVGIGASLGFFFSPLYAGWRAGMPGWSAELTGWRQPVLELGLFGIVGTILFLCLAAEEQRSQEPQPHHSMPPSQNAVKLFPTPMLWLVFLGASFAFCFRDFAGSGMASLGSLFLQHARDFDARQTGITLSCLYLASAISNPIFGALSDSGRVRWTSFVLIIAAAAIFAFPRVPTAWTIPVLAVYGFFFMASFPMVEAMLMESVHDSVRGRVFGCFITIGGFFGNLSHWFVGNRVKHLGNTAQEPSSYYGLYTLLAVFVLVSLAGLACMHMVRKGEPKSLRSKLIKSHEST